MCQGPRGSVEDFPRRGADLGPGAAVAGRDVELEVDGGENLIDGGPMLCRAAETKDLGRENRMPA
jgi:hypothetical protein